MSQAQALALVRIVAGLVILTSGDLHHAPRFAELAPELTFGFAWLRVPHGLAEALRWIVSGAALAGTVGLYARASYSLVAGGALLLLALPQRVGAITHCHHLVWVAVMLAASPCSDVWSLDAYFERREVRAEGAYAFPLACLRALVAAVYFFPGLHKLLAFASGTDPGAWLRAQLAWKWMQHGSAPALPLSLTPLAGVLAFGALLFELGMPLLVAWQRRVALASAIAFHIATAWLLFIRFDSLAALLVSLIGPRTAWSWRDALLGSRIAGAILVSGACIAGVLGATQAYPFACYPTFAEQPPPTMPSARVEVGNCVIRPRTNPEWVQAYRISGAYGDHPRANQYRAYALSVAERCPRQGHVSLYLERLTWHDGVRVVRERLVYEQ